MSQTIRFTKKFGRYNVGQTKKVTNSDAVRMGKLGLAEVVTATGEAGETQTRMLTTQRKPLMNRKQAVKAALKAAQEAAAKVEAPAPVPESAPQPEAQLQDNPDDSTAVTAAANPDDSSSAV